ncbi:MAG: cell division protein FtsA [Parcubacteria group bacterium]|nr:cell division protein FtsA [Parcubacteria group bacterium]
MSRERIITALDLGSHQVRVATLLVDSASSQRAGEAGLRVIALGQSAARGIRRGQVIDLKEVTDSIKEAVVLASKSGNVKISRLVVGLGGPHFKLMSSRGSVAVSRADGEIAYEDVMRVLESARAVSLPLNREIVHVIPLEYRVDSEEGVKDPVGMKGVRLEAAVTLVLGSTPVLRLVKKAFQEAGLAVDNWVYTPLAGAGAVLTKKQRELGAVVLDIGASTTSLSVWEESNLKHAEVLPVGAGRITDDVAIGFKVSPEISEKIKVEHGCSLSALVSKREQAVLADWGTDNLVLPKWELARIIEARASEIFGLVNEELKRIGKAGLLPAGAVLVGGGVKMEGMAELAKRRLKLPVELGRIRNIKSDFNEVFDSDFATLAGLLLWQYDYENARQKKPLAAEMVLAGNWWAKIKEWFYDLVP